MKSAFKKIAILAAAGLLMVAGTAFASSREVEVRIKNTAPDYLGNETINIRNGGYFMTYEDVSYIADKSGIYILEDDGNKEYICTEPAANLNAMYGYIYYTSGSEIRRVSAKGEESTLVYDAGNDVVRMYVQNNGLIKYCGGGDAWLIALDPDGKYSAGAQIVSDLDNVCDIIPTESGDIIICGSLGEYSVYADDECMLSELYNYYEKDGFLVITDESGTSKVDVAVLFDDEFSEMDVEDYDFGEDVTAEDFEEMLSDADDAIAAAEGEGTGDAFYGEEEYEDSASERKTTGTSDTLTARQTNVVNRAYSLAYLRWTARGNITGWRGLEENSMIAGDTYTGIPYSQPYTSPGGYVGYASAVATPALFYNETQNPSSLLYTTVKTIYGVKMPYYGTDCSAFVSYCWGISRRTTYTLPSLSGITRIGSSAGSLYEMQVGDILNMRISHVVIITDIKRDAQGNITSVEITEQTDPFTKVTTYNSIAVLASKYMKNGYILYRYSKMGSLAADPSPTSSAESESGTSSTVQAEVTLKSISHGNGTATIDWEPLSGARGYRIFRKTGENGKWKVLVEKTTKTSYTDKSISNNKTYYYTVRAYYGKYSVANKNRYKNEYWSSYDKTGLAARKTPVLVSAKNTREGVEIVWKANESAYYNVLRKASGGKWKVIATTNLTSYTDATAKSGTTYYYTVRSRNSSNTEPISYFNSAGKKVTYLDAPVLKSAESVSGAVEIKWGKVSGASGYAVFRKTAGGSWKMIENGVKSTSYKDTTARAGRTYIYTVRAYKGNYSDAYKNRFSSSYWGSFDNVGVSVTYQMESADE